jgi:hypothetical protein
VWEGLEADAFSAHGLRAGYLTEAARQGVGLLEATQQSQHRSAQQAASYYNEAERARQGGKAGASAVVYNFVEVRPRLRSFDSRAE